MNLFRRHHHSEARSKFWCTLSAFYPCPRNNNPQEPSFTEALGAWFCWVLNARLGSSHERFSNGIQEVEGSIPFGSTTLRSRELRVAGGDFIGGGNTPAAKWLGLFRNEESKHEQNI